MDPLLKKVTNLPDDWRGSVTSVASVLGVARSTVYGYEEKHLLEPDVIRGNRRYYSKSCLLRFVRDWFTNPDRNKAVKS